MDSKRKIKINIAVFSLIFIALIAFCLFPLLSKLSEKSKEVINQKALLKSLEDQLAVLKDFQDNGSAYQSNVEKLEGSFVSNEAPVEFIGFLEKLASKYGLEITLSSAKDVLDKKENRVTISFQATLGGDYPVILTFLRKLEQSSWLIKIDQIDMARVEDSSKLYGATLEEGQVVLRLGFKAFSNYLSPTL